MRLWIGAISVFAAVVTMQQVNSHGAASAASSRSGFGSHASNSPANAKHDPSFGLMYHGCLPPPADAGSACHS